MMNVVSENTTDDPYVAVSGSFGVGAALRQSLTLRFTPQEAAELEKILAAYRRRMAKESK